MTALTNKTDVAAQANKNGTNITKDNAVLPWLEHFQMIHLRNICKSMHFVARHVV